jgi:hypothetical protein
MSELGIGVTVLATSREGNYVVEVKILGIDGISADSAKASVALKNNRAHHNVNYGSRRSVGVLARSICGHKFSPARSNAPLIP